MKWSLQKWKAWILCVVLLAGNLSLTGGTSWANTSPPSIIHTPITSTDKVDLTVTAYVYTPVQQVTLTYSTNANSDDPIFNDMNMQPTASNPNMFQAVIPQSDLQNTDQLKYHITATDSQSQTSRLPASTNYKVPVVTVPAEPDKLSFNLSVNQSVYGKVQVNGKGGSLSDLQLQIDNHTVTNTVYNLARPAKIVFDGNGLQASQRLKNGVYLNGQLLQVIPVDVLNFNTYEVPVPASTLLPDKNIITIRAGNTVSPTDPVGNHDDFTIRNVKLVLDDGTQLTDPTYGANESIAMGDGTPPTPSNLPLFVDFNIQIPTNVANAIVYDWDTTQVSDGPHIFTLNDLSQTLAPIQTTIQVDNTLPSLTIQSPVENQSYKGTIPLTFSSSDSGSGLKPLKLTLDGVAIANTASLRAVDLQSGEHTLQVSAEDIVGNVTVKEVHFTSVDVHPLPPQVIAPADNSGDVSINPTLKVKIEDPNGDALNATFLKAYKYDFKDGLSHTAYTNATDTEPPLEMMPQGETQLTSDQIQAISADDGTYMTTDDTVKFPYQRFEFKINDDLMNAKSVDAVWNGHSFPGRRVTLYGWNYSTSKWQELDSKVAPDENDFMLKGAIFVADMVRNQKAEIIVQDLIPSPPPQTPDQYNFSFVWMPDTQFYSKSYPNIYDSQSQWIVDHAADQKIKYVIHTGDVVDDGYKPEQWVNADHSMKILDDAHIPYGIVAGNHDVQPGATQGFDYTAFGQWFGADRFAGRSYYAGQFQNNRDHFDLISVNGYDFVIVYLGWQPEQPDLDWAAGVLKKYSDRNAIIAIHQFIDGNGQYGGAAEQVREQLIKPNNNVFLVINGHHTNSPKNITEQFGDRTVHEVFTNYQTQPEGGSGYMRLLKFDTVNNMLYMNTYSPYLNDYDWFSTKLEELALPVKLLPIQKRVATDYISIQARTDEVIGDKVIAAPSGSEVSATWNGLQFNKLYNWYVNLENAYDGLTQSDIYTFNTVQYSMLPSSSSSGGTSTNSGTIVANSGGTLTLNGAKISLPAGAMDSDIQVTVNKISDTSILPVDNALTMLSDVYEIKKSKDGNFIKPVVITLPFDKTKVDFTKSTVGLYWLNEQTHTWVQLDNLQVDQATGEVSGSVTHFTKFAVLASDKVANLPPQATQPQSNEVNFADIKGHWAETSVRDMVKLGAINGYSDNTFKPDNNITRAEFVTVIVKAFNLKVQVDKNFADTGAHWAKNAIATAAALGVVGGYSETAFGPDDPITREQMAAIVIRAEQIDLADKNISFTDSSSISDWARTALATATAKGLINGYEDGTVKPQANTTRAEAVSIILRALQLKK